MRVVALGELLLRLSPPGFCRLRQAKEFSVCYGGGEANVAAALARWGIDAAFVTALPDNAIGYAALDSLRACGVDTSHIAFTQGRMGLYYLEKGASQRPSQVVYDRAGSAFACVKPQALDLERALTGADVLHISGITPALSDTARDIALLAVKAAKAAGARVSLDVNYRSKLWTVEEAARTMAAVMPFVDVLIANEEHAKLILGVEAAAAFVGGDGELTDEGYADLVAKLSKKYPAQTVALTVRRTRSALVNDFWAIVRTDGATHVSKKYRIDIVDRVGAGDAFTAGLLYALLSGYDGARSVEFAAASGCLKHSIEGDVNLVSADEIEALVKGNGNGRVSR